MPLAPTRQGSLHYEIVDQVVPWRERRDAILFHHGIGACAEIWAGWFPSLQEAYRLVRFDMRGYGRSTIPAPDFVWSLDLLVDDLFAVADAAGLQRFHLVGESIGGTVALAAALARPDRIATLTVSNGAHLGASIQRVEAWRRQLIKGGSKAWSDAFMRDRFHEDALSAERWTWFAAQQEKWTAPSILNALAVLVGDRPLAPVAGHNMSDPSAAPRWQPLHPGAHHRRTPPVVARGRAQRDRPFTAWSALFSCSDMCGATADFSRLANGRLISVRYTSR
ncbi:hypothetical protein BH11PSE3_BH11PSE3_01430 [soil metagenome]